MSLHLILGSAGDLTGKSKLGARKQDSQVCFGPDYMVRIPSIDVSSC